MSQAQAAAVQKQQIRLLLEEMAFLGEALARHEGHPVFVANGIPGEEVVVEVRRKGRRYLEAEVVEVVKPSPHRVRPPCPYVGACTGCQWQHVEYSHQLLLKSHAVEEQLRRVGRFDDPPVLPTLPCDNPWNYRNHARFTIGPGGQLGFVNRTTRRFVRIDSCLLMHQGINEILKQLQDRCQETTQLTVRYGVNTGEHMIQPTLQSLEIGPASGQKHYEEEVMGRRFRIASPSFFQVNILQAEKLVRLVGDRLELSQDDILLDAYAGVGTFAVLLSPRVRRVIAVEESPAAVRDAQANAAGLANIEFMEGKAEILVGQLADRPSKVILDPPRAGCHPSAVTGLAQLGPSRIAYVSCDPATLARDLRLLCDAGYRLLEVQPIDMFPQTHHVESVATLQRSA